jgi:hypothetical protein
MLIAVDGLVQNQGLAVNAGLTDSISSYVGITAVSSYTAVLGNAISNGSLSSNTVSSMQTLAGNVLPAVTNAVTPAYVSAFGALGNTDSGGLSGQVVDQAQTVMGNGDLSKFVQIYNAARSYIYQNNQIVSSLINSDLLANTFTTMTALTTGNTSDLNRDLTKLAEDLTDLGQAWNLNNLDYLGYPWALVSQMADQAGLLPEFIDRLNDNGVTTDQLSQVLEDGSAVSLEVNDKIYKTMQSITGDLLEQVKFLLSVTTPGLNNMADLLNPAKILPRSYLNLTLRVVTSNPTVSFGTELVNLYLSADTINSNLLTQFRSDAEYQDLSKVIPPDQALANRAIARSLQQIKNIFVPELPDFADALIAVEENQNLNLIQSLQQPIPTAIRTSLNSLLATGTGPDGTITLFDMIGVAAGTPYTEFYQTVIAGVSSLQSNGALLTLTNSIDGVYTVMQNALDGDYDVEIPPDDPEDPSTFIIVIPSPLPGAGTYADLNEAFAAGLIPAAESLIATIAINNANIADSLNASVTEIVDRLIAEKQNFALTELDLADLEPGDRSSLMGLAFNLHEIGTDVSPTGSAVYFDAIADRSNVYGQAIVAAMREGRNIAALNDVGIDLDTQIPLSPI